MRTNVSNKLRRGLTAFLAAVLLSAPAFEIVHNREHHHSLCAEHAGEWIESHASHASKDKAEATLAWTNAERADANGEHADCAWLAAREQARTLGKNFSTAIVTVFSATSSIAAPAADRRLAIYRLAPKTSPPRLS